VTPLGDHADEDVVALYTDAARPRAEREAAFGEIVRRYERRIFAVCLRTLGNATDAEDAAQDTFVNLARRADQYRGDSAWSTFVYRVAVNACRDLQRREGRRPHVPVGDITEVVDGTTASPDTAPDQAAGRETARAVQAALDRLDDLSRTLIVLCAIEGLSYPEAARVLDMPVGTIKSRVFRARARLAEMLADPTEDDDAPPSTPRAPASTDVPPGRRPRGPPT
jgi:RNA polymerase sigma-70 factor (ECF subfamily)